MTLSDGAAVATWFDLSPKDRDVPASSVSSERPTFKTAILNGLSIVRFDGGDWMRLALGVTIAQPTTIFVVAKTNATSSQAMFIDGAAADPHRQAVYVESGTFRMYAGNVPLVGPSADTNWHIFCAVFNGASSKLRVDGGAGTSSNPGTGDLTGITIGADPFSGSKLNGDVADVIPFSGSLSLANMNAIGRTLSLETGLLWTTAT